MIGIPSFHFYLWTLRESLSSMDPEEGFDALDNLNKMELCTIVCFGHEHGAVYNARLENLLLEIWSVKHAVLIAVNSI